MIKKLRIRPGFTLAEVLITLGIIGVVAAMTMPALINNTRNQELQTQLKTAYSILSQGLSMMSADKGMTITPDYVKGRVTHSDWEEDNTASGSLYDEYKTYFQKIYDCGQFNPNEKICMPRGNAPGSSGYYDSVYKNFNGSASANSSNFDDGQFVLQNGMLVMINDNGSGDNIYVSVDVNGKPKRPNRLGQDVFMFQLMNDGKFLPMGAEGTDFPEDTYCTISSTDEKNGLGCTVKALTDKDFFKNLPK